MNYHMSDNLAVMRYAVVLTLTILLTSHPLSSVCHGATANTQAPDQKTDAQFPLKLQIPNEKRNEFNLIVFDGVPANITFSAGFRSGQKWFVSVTDISTLKIGVVSDFVGLLRLHVSFLTSGQDAPIVRTISFQVTPEGIREGPPQTNDTVGVETKVPGLSAGEEAAMLKQGGDFIKMGDLAGARLLYEELAAEGSAKGALAMGQSYDPAFLAKGKFQGAPKPDARQAARWYRKAAELGSKDAQKFLTALGDEKR